jgi:hypothetical protein
MYMTDEQKYNAVLKELGELLQGKNTTISCQKWQIDELKEKLKAAEKERDEWHNGWRIAADQRDDALIELKELQGTGSTEVRKKGEEIVLLLDNEAVNALRAINAELRKIYDERGCIMCGGELSALQDEIKRVLPVNGGAA